MVGEEEEKPPSPAAVVQVQVRAELLLFSFFACVIQVLYTPTFGLKSFFVRHSFLFLSLSRADDTVERGGERGTRRGGEKFLTCLACLEL